MSNSTIDFYHQKTDAELLYFIQHPELYQADLVSSARRELQRRGVSLPFAAAPSAVADVYNNPNKTAPASSLGKIVAIGLVVAALGGGSYWLKQSYDSDVALVQFREEARRKLPPPRLVEVATSAIPNYDGLVAQTVEQQLNKVPAREKANAQHLRQFRELTKRFWAAQTQSEYLVDQANAGKANPNFAEQTVVVRETWRAWNQAAVYTYKFGPTMASHFQVMGKAASNQQHILANLPDLLPNRAFLKDKEMVSRTAEVQDLLGNLLPVSPVSGNTYKRTVLHM